MSKIPSGFGSTGGTSQKYLVNRKGLQGVSGVKTNSRKEDSFYLEDSERETTHPCGQFKEEGLVEDCSYTIRVSQLQGTSRYWSRLSLSCYQTGPRS